MDKLDYKKELKSLYNPTGKDFTLVEVPPLNFLMVDGHGDPNVAQEYVHAVEALYAVAYKLKFLCKQEKGVDFTVMPLEGLWWSQDMNAFVEQRKSDWDWTMMIMQPAPVLAEMLPVAVQQAARSKDLPALARLRWECYAEGLSVQIMHTGSYADETPTLARLHQEYLPAHSLAPSGKHHEIYLGDPRKTAPEKLKTVLRQPVRRI